MIIRTFYYRVPSKSLSALRRKGPPPDIELLLKGPSIWTPHPRGGVTKVFIEDENGDVQASGTAFCSMADNFCRKIGRKIATGRALKRLEEAQSEEVAKADPAQRL
jgi:hypothetical protein